MVIRASTYEPTSKDTMTSTNAVLDHIVWLIPYSELLHPPAWLTQLFTISPGGTHSGGRTANKLILFRDGTYIELIAFVNDDPAKRRGHPWDLPFGLVDFAFSVIKPKELDYEALASRMGESGTGVEYSPLADGGRRTPKGVELKWRISVPRGNGVDRGDLPFWCIDVTPRERRVPYQGEEGEKATTHACGMTGIKGVRLRIADEEKCVRVEKALRAALDLGEDREIEVGAPLGSTRFVDLRAFVDLKVLGEMDDRMVLVARGGEEYEPPKKDLKRDSISGEIGGARLTIQFD